MVVVFGVCCREGELVKCVHISTRRLSHRLSHYGGSLRCHAPTLCINSYVRLDVSLCAFLDYIQYYGFYEVLSLSYT